MDKIIYILTNESMPGYESETLDERRRRFESGE